MSRALAITEEKRVVLEQLLRKGVPVRPACQLAGVGRRTFYDYLRRGDAGEEPYRAIVEGIRLAQSEHHSELVELVHAHAKDDPATARHLLACAMRDTYGPEGRMVDAVDEAWGEATEDEVVELMAKDPRVVAAVLAAKGGELGPGNDTD